MPKTKQAVRVRFAPSPTGGLHIGSARTALFNWLYARKHGGQFVLRIEDTDKERNSKQHEQQIMHGLRWLGLDWDEGPDTDGSHGPYRQSERLEAGTYKAHVEKLLSEGLAYYCFCKPEELERDRKSMLASGNAPVYSGKCCNLKSDEREAHVNEGRSPVIRFRVPDREVVFTDLVRGEIRVHGKDFGDFVIARTDGTPLFLLANIIDDVEMQITHVLRGEDHISNTPKQLLLAEALGFEPPQYGHLPLILNPDRSKMSKRAGPTHVGEYKKLGYLPGALVNYMALLGWNPGSEQEIFSTDALIKAFSADGINKAGAIFDLTRLNWLNAQYVKALGDQDYLEYSRTFIAAEDSVTSEKAVQIVRDRVQFFSELPELISFSDKTPEYKTELLSWKETSIAETNLVLKAVRDFIEHLAEGEMGDPEDIEKSLRKNAEASGREVGEVFWPLRVALSGLKASPGPQEILWVIGKKEALKRLDVAIEMTEGTG